QDSAGAGEAESGHRAEKGRRGPAETPRSGHTPTGRGNAPHHPGSRGQNAFRKPTPPGNHYRRESEVSGVSQDRGAGSQVGTRKTRDGSETAKAPRRSQDQGGREQARAGRSAAEATDNYPATAALLLLPPLP